MMDFMLAPAVYQDRFNPPLRFVLHIQALFSCGFHCAPQNRV